MREVLESFKRTLGRAVEELGRRLVPEKPEPVPVRVPVEPEFWRRAR